MKTSFQRKGLFSVLATGLIAGSLFLASCMKDNNGPNNNAQMYTTSGNANGAQQSPPSGSSGTATLTGTYNTTTNLWQYSINWTNLSTTATAVEVHGPAELGVNAGLAFALGITTSGATGSANGSTTLTAQQEADLLAGKLYYTILTATNITGEIRGQIYTSAQ